MELFRNLFEGYPNLWGGEVAHSVLILSLVICFRHHVRKNKSGRYLIGSNWMLFVGCIQSFQSEFGRTSVAFS